MTELPPAGAVTVGRGAHLEAASVHAPAGLHRISVPLLRLRSDDQLVALFRKGDEDAFQVIHERYRQRLFAYARQMLAGSRSDAEDAMQDVFLRAYGALRANDRPVTLRAWLYRVAHNRCIDQLRRPLPAAVDLFDITRGPSLHDPLEQAERREDLRRLVSDVRRLPDQQRSALLMREMEGLSYKELAEALVVSIPAVKSLLVRARIGLVEAIEARDASCGDIRLDIAAAADKGVRASGRARRHMRECSSCREYRGALRGDLKQLNSLGAGHGMLATGAKVLGIGGAGSGAAAGGGAAPAGGGAAGPGGGAAGTKTPRPGPAPGGRRGGRRRGQRGRRGSGHRRRRRRNEGRRAGLLRGGRRRQRGRGAARHGAAEANPGPRGGAARDVGSRATADHPRPTRGRPGR